MTCGRELQTLETLLSDTYAEGYNRTLFTLGQGIGASVSFQKFDESALAKILKRPWTTDGKTFRDRCWTNKTALIESLQKTLTQGIIAGTDPRTLTKQMSRAMNASAYKAGRLVMTESAYFAAEARRDCFKALEVERYEIIGTLDTSTCSTCGDLDGHVFRQADYEPGVTAPPFHPNCRCTTAPYFDDWEALGAEPTRAARDEDDRTTQMRDMTYEEWSHCNVQNTEVTQQEKSFSAGVGAPDVDLDYINSAEYREKFNAISDNRALNQSIYRYCKAALTHQSGDYFEDLTILKTDGSLIGQTSGLIRNETYYNSKLREAVSKAKPYTLVSIHNHGTNLPPSGADLVSAGYHKYAFGIVCCSDGSLYYYSCSKARSFLPIRYDKAVDKYKGTPYNLGGKEAMIKALNEMQDFYGVEWRQLN